MILTPSQIAQVLSALAGKVDDQTMAVVKQLLEYTTGMDGLPPGDSYEEIKAHSQRLFKQFQTLGRGIATDSPQEETMVVYMDMNKVKRLLPRVPADGYIAALPGIASGSGKEHLTISLLAADRNFRIMPDHISGGVCGEQSWDNRNIMSSMDVVLPNH